MKKIFLLIFLLSQFSAYSQLPVENYAVDSASVEHPGVPKGELIK